jgi:hypothetical protein
LGESFYIIEQYSTYKVRKGEAERSALPWRRDRLLLAPAFYYPAMDPSTSSPNQALTARALTAGLAIRQILIDEAKKSGGHHSYVNYSYGRETAEELYGKHVARLKKLKRKWDGEDRFRFYAPVGVGRGEVRDEL